MGLGQWLLLADTTSDGDVSDERDAHVACEPARGWRGVRPDSPEPEYLSEHTPRTSRRRFQNRAQTVAVATGNPERTEGERGEAAYEPRIGDPAAASRMARVDGADGAHPSLLENGDSRALAQIFASKGGPRRRRQNRLRGRRLTLLGCCAGPPGIGTPRSRK